MNPFLPEGVYIPDGEAHVFGDRVYLVGSHDRPGGPLYCMEDYEVWSAPVDDLAAWASHGVAYRAEQDPYNDGSHPNRARGAERGLHYLYAPDVCRGPDGRFYLYYCLDTVSRVGVAVADEPGGPYTFLDYVRTTRGEILGERPDDLVQFDPAVLVDEGRVYLYTGNAPMNRVHQATGFRRNHSMVTELEPDMITVKDGPHRLLPDVTESRGTSFQGHELFEASSIRRIGDTYYLVYSDVHSHNLAYATSNSPMGGFEYRGVLISNGDIGLDGRRSITQAAMPIGNNHGCVEQIDGRWYVFYHRHTHGRPASRQACAEPIELHPDGTFTRARMSSSGLNGGPLPGTGTYSARIASRLTTRRGGNTFSVWRDHFFPHLAQESTSDGPRQYVANLRSGATAGFSSFAGLGRTLSVVTRSSGAGRLVVTTGAGQRLAEIPVTRSSGWATSAAVVLSRPDEEDDVTLLFTYRGRGRLDLASFSLE